MLKLVDYLEEEECSFSEAYMFKQCLRSMTQRHEYINTYLNTSFDRSCYYFTTSLCGMFWWLNCQRKQADTTCL